MERKNIEDIVAEVKERANIDISQFETIQQLLERAPETGKQDFLIKLIEGHTSEEELALGVDRFQLKDDKSRVIFLMTSPDSQAVKSIVEHIYTEDQNNHVLLMKDGGLVLIKEVDDQPSEHVASTIVHTIEAELMIQLDVAYGSSCQKLMDLSRGYTEAMVAREVAKKFYPDKPIISYEELGLGRVIDGLTKELSEAYLKDVLKGNSLNDFDEETMMAVYKFFQNNLNISETARQLFYHRNTLVYRLEKIQKKTGLDLRQFEDAMTFKTAIMVAKHLEIIN